MGQRNENGRRSQVGYGSTYNRGGIPGSAGDKGIQTVLGGQVWTVSPDRKADVSHPCVWMQAGAVKMKNCNNFYDCVSCKYDLGMRKKVEQGKQISWQDAMRRKSALDRVCRHSLTQRIGKRSCAYDYQCATCDFDQFFEDVWSAKTNTEPAEQRTIRGFDVPPAQLYHNGHTWIRIESGGFIRIGLDDFANKLLGKADAFDLPLMGKELDQDSPGWGLRRRENEAAVLSPINGVIVEVNAAVRENPGLANREPYGDGWLFLVRTPDVKKAVSKLMAEEASLAWINSEVDCLEKMVESVAGPLAADGGYFTDDIFGALPNLGWNNLKKTFLKS